jgi:hypothetical protein
VAIAYTAATMYKGFLAGLAIGCSTLVGSPPDAYDVIARSVKATEGNWTEAPNYSFLRVDAKSKHGSQPVKAVYEVLMIEGSPYQKIVAEDGHPLPALRADEEEQKLRRERAKRESESARERRRRIEKYTEDRDRDHAMLMELCDAFDYTVTGEQHIGEDSVWLLEGKPKPGYMAKTRAAKVLAGMNVKFWIEKTSYQWMRVEAEVMRPISLYGAIAKVGPGTKFVLEQEQVSPNLWLPKHFATQVKASALGFINEDSVQDETYSNYRLGTSSVNALSGGGRSATASEKEATGLQ